MAFFINIFMEPVDNTRVIMLQDLMEDNAAKKAELEYYEECLQDLLVKMHMVKAEINLTETIINVIKSEKADVLKRFIKKKDDSRIL